MSGRNCQWVEYPPTASSLDDVRLLSEGFAIVREAKGTFGKQLVFRPTRGSGGFSIWSDRRRAERDCEEGESVVAVRLLVEVAP